MSVTDSTFEVFGQIIEDEPVVGSVGGSQVFWTAKRVFDIAGCLLLLPILILFIPFLLLMNPFFNRGPLFYAQIRMGKECRAFKAYKFRSMKCAAKISRGHDDPIEEERISKFGRFLRKSRIDELPQVFNVLKGEMSLIGPRPDFFLHARKFVRHIPEYRHRHQVRPGISGLAQVSLGYAEGIEATRDKVRADLEYIRDAGFALEAKLVAATIQTILRGAGM